MSAGHFSREFRARTASRSYGYLMTRRIERAMALLRRGDLTVTEVCFAVGCSSLGTLSTRFTELVGMPPSAYRQREAAATAGMAPCVAKQVTRPVRNREAPASSRAQPGRHEHHHSRKHASAPRSRRHAGLLPRHPRFEVPQDVEYGGMHWITVGPPGQPDTSIVLYPPQATPGITDDERSTIAEMMAKGTSPASTWPPTTSTAPSTGCRPATPRSSRSPRPAVRASRLRLSRPGREPDPHPGGAPDG